MLFNLLRLHQKSGKTTITYQQKFARLKARSASIALASIFLFGAIPKSEAKSSEQSSSQAEERGDRSVKEKKEVPSPSAAAEGRIKREAARVIKAFEGAWTSTVTLDIPSLFPQPLAFPMFVDCSPIAQNRGIRCFNRGDIPGGNVLAEDCIIGFSAEDDLVYYMCASGGGRSSVEKGVWVNDTTIEFEPEQIQFLGMPVTEKLTISVPDSNSLIFHVDITLPDGNRGVLHGPSVPRKGPAPVIVNRPPVNEASKKLLEANLGNWSTSGTFTFPQGRAQAFRLETQCEEAALGPVVYCQSKDVSKRNTKYEHDCIWAYNAVYDQINLNCLNSESQVRAYRGNWTSDSKLKLEAPVGKNQGTPANDTLELEYVGANLTKFQGLFKVIPGLLDLQLNGSSQRFK